LERGQHDYPHARQRGIAGDVDQGGQTVVTGHADVHEYHVGYGLADYREGLRAVGGLTHQLDVALGIDECAQPHPDERLIVGDHDPDHRADPAGAAAGPGSGMLAWTRKPPPGTGPIVSCPPSDATRSRMPRTPLPSLAPSGPVGPVPVSVTSISRIGPLRR